MRLHSPNHRHSTITDTAQSLTRHADLNPAPPRAREGPNIDARIQHALAITPASSAAARTVDITTIGAKTGRERRIEIWFYRVDDEIYLTTQPATRGWYANLLHHPRFTFHLTGSVRADLAATAEPVLETGERRRIFEAIIADLDHPRHSAYLSQPVEPLEQWMDGSPLMHVTFLEE